MSSIHDLTDFREKKKPISRSHIADVLRAVGGAAHRDTIVDLLIGKYKLKIPKVAVREEVDAVLRAPSQSIRFERVFGPQSHRWRLAQVAARATDGRARVQPFKQSETA